jgi:hypothetical protein
MTYTRVLALVVATATAITGCSGGSDRGIWPLPHAAANVDALAPESTSNGAPAVGPGPTNYTIERQPAPGSCQYRQSPTGEPLPDPRCTPGAVNPKVTQETLAHTICRPGYTKSIRPSVDVTRAEKRANAESYAFTGNLADAEYDHLVALEIGGDPNDPRNLWVEPPSPGHRSKDGVNNDKDAVENKLASAVCGGRILLADAQVAIATDWTTALDRLGLADSPAR